MGTYVYVSNTLNTTKYTENTISKFTNILKPPLIFQENTTWEVALTSCILPFESYSYASQGDELFELIWIIEKEWENEVKKKCIN